MLIDGSDGQEFLASTHGKLGCVSCHGGNKEAQSMEEAHQGVQKDPSENPEKYCAGCHADVVSRHMTSIHRTQQGYFSFFGQRHAGDMNAEVPHEFTTEFNKECGVCHATCGQCHVSVPNSAKGGLISSHKFNKTPNMTKNCTACHGSRIGDEYLGSNAEAVPGVLPDTHWQNEFMRCEACHSGSEMHGDGNSYTSKLKVNEMPRCEDCHEKGTNAYHIKHWGELSCTSCHAQSYRNCNSCHVGGSGITGDPYFGVKIAKNYESERNYQWITVRHIPITNDTYAEWGFADLPYYDSMPSWKYTMPHNVQKLTAQTAADSAAVIPCAGSCHHNEALFLRPADVDPAELNANDALIVKDTDWPVGP